MTLPLPLRELLRRFFAEARRRGAMVGRARACDHARGRRIRAEAEAGCRAVICCAEARARAAHEYVRHARRQAGAAAVAAWRRFLQASDSAGCIFMRVSYGESPPRIPSYPELCKMLEQRLLSMESLVSTGNKILKLNDIFNIFSPYSTSYIIATILTPIALYYEHFVTNTAPDTLQICPFLGISSIDFGDDFPIREGLVAVLHLSARCGGVIMLWVGGLLLCFCSDIGTLAVSVVGKSSYQTVRCFGDEWIYSEVRSVEWGEY